MKKILEITSLEELDEVQDLKQFDYLVIRDVAFYTKSIIVHPGIDTERIKWFAQKIFQLHQRLTEKNDGQA